MRDRPQGPLAACDGPICKGRETTDFAPRDDAKGGRKNTFYTQCRPCLSYKRRVKEDKKKRDKENEGTGLENHIQHTALLGQQGASSQDNL